jgi:ssDNA-binding Zn-finger/Zn-ribbon topoisomerase 1
MAGSMPEVTCPQCRARQPVPEDAHGYRCVVCAASWNFVRCTVCGERFHTRPGTRAWTCPTCGTPHGRNRRGISRPGAPVPLLIGALIAVGALVAVAQALGGDDGLITPPPTTPTQVADPFDHVCETLSEELQVFRVEQLQRAADALQDDAVALRALGERTSAVAVEGVVAAIQEYQAVANGGGDTQAATNQLLDALDAVDWCP